MAWFSPIKGSYPSLAQIDRTLPATGTFERGTILKVADGKFAVATDASVLPLYIALQGTSDTQAGMAGGLLAEGSQATVPSVPVTVPAVTGLALAQEGEYQIEVDADATFAVGDALTVANGKLAKSTAEGDKIVGVVTKGKFVRYVNDKVAVVGQRTGANATVIQFTTAL